VPAFDADREKFAALDAQVLDISTDSILSHIAWQKKDIGIMHLPMCADFYPHGEVTKRFGILREGAPVPGIAERAVFIVNKAGNIAFTKVYSLDQTPNNAELLAVLRKIE
jgi:alkyl hydroperoxide reductase subunit AhpC